MVQFTINFDIDAVSRMKIIGAGQAVTAPMNIERTVTFQDETEVTVRFGGTTNRFDRR